MHKNNIREMLQIQANDYPEKAAIIFRGDVITFSQLKDNVFRLANNMMSAGIKKQDKVALYLPNWPEYIFSYLALFSIGATVVPLDYMFKEDELRACLKHSEASVLVAKSKEGVLFESLRKDLSSLKNIMLVQEKKTGFLPFDDFCSQGSSEKPDMEINDSDISLILYTSGSTGRPKGVVLNYGHLRASPEAMKHFVDFTPKDIKISALPLSHAGGLVYIQNCIFFSITLILMERFIPLEFLKNIEKYRVTCFHMVPAMYYALLHLKEFEKFDLSSIRWVNVFGAPNSPATIRRFKAYCPNAKLLNGWGLSETNAPNTVTPMGSDNIESIGRPAPWINIKLFDDSGKEVCEGEVGELAIKSWVVMVGYYRDPELTSQVLKDGWFYTGDLARKDSEGMYYIVGRKKDMIKVSGQIVFPSEIEEVIHKHPHVREVAVIGVPDSLRGEKIKAYIVLKGEEKLLVQDIREFCRQHLAHFKLPSDYVFVQDLPKTRSGKTDKALLKQRA